jgi:hypothetical protein
MEARDEYVQRCFRHQHPEAYGRDPVLPPKAHEVVHSSEETHSGTRYMAVGPMEEGHPEAVLLPTSSWAIWEELGRARGD